MDFSSHHTETTIFEKIYIIIKIGRNFDFTVISVIWSFFFFFFN